MDQPYTKENLEAAMEHVRKLLGEVKTLEALFPDRHFTLDGLLVGNLGEVFAAYHYEIKLYKQSTKGYDGTVNGRNIQVKTTQGDDVPIRMKPDYLIVLYLSKTGKIYEAYNGPGTIPWKVPGKPDKRGYKHLRVNKLMSLDGEIKPEDRIAAVHPIEKLTPELKNHRTTKPNIDAASGRNPTDDEKIDAAAKRVLEKYRPAFEELAK